MIEIGRTEQMIVEMDKLAKEDHSYKASREEIEFYRGNWWIHSNLARVDSIPTRYEPEFKSALSTMQRLKRAEDKRSKKQWHKPLHPRLHGTGIQVWWDRTGEPVKEEEKRVLRNHDRTGEPVEGRLHKVQEDGYLKNRDDANKFNLAMDDENIDFNISGVPNAMVKRSQSICVQNLIQKIESHPQREALKNDLQQHRAFNLFSKVERCDYGCWEY